MNTPPRKRNKTTSATSSNSDSESPNSDIASSEDPASAIIDVPAVEVSELTEQEQSDRLFLERKVERAFFEAGKALVKLFRRARKPAPKFTLNYANTYSYVVNFGSL